MIRKIISFVIPLSRKIKSAHNGYLELLQINGRTFLNTANTNYSYGSLQRVLQFSLRQVDLSRSKNALILGLGGGCVLKSLRKEFKFLGYITAVDIDPVIIAIAEKEFGVVPDEKTRIVCSDAFDYMLGDPEKFDLIIIDLFIDNQVPDKFLLQDFWRAVINKTNTDGTIIFNTLCVPFTDIQPVKNKLKKRGLEWRLFRYVEKTNKVLIANNHQGY